MSTNKQIIVTIKLAWWLKPYFVLLATFCAITGMEPDEDRLSRIIDRAMTPMVDWER